MLALSGSLAWSGERRGRAKMGGCRVGRGRDDDDGDGDGDGRFCRQAWRTYIRCTINLLAARMKSNGVASAIRLCCGRRAGEHCGREESLSHWDRHRYANPPC